MELQTQQASFYPSKGHRLGSQSDVNNKRKMWRYVLLSVTNSYRA